MNQREEVLQAWDRYSASAYPSPQLEKARAFFQMVHDRRDLCWDEFAEQFRSKYYDALEPLSVVLMATNNALIMYNFTRYADANKAPEANVLKNFIRQADGDKHQVSLAVLAAHPAMQSELLNKGQLPDLVAGVLKPKADTSDGTPGAQNA